MIKTIALAAALIGTTTIAGAEQLNAIHNANIDLGATRGSAYYYVGQDGYHLVATLISDSAATPVRFDTVLADGQSATLSIPGPVGTHPQELTFTRTADHMVVRRSVTQREIATQ